MPLASSFPFLFASHTLLFLFSVSCSLLLTQSFINFENAHWLIYKIITSQVLWKFRAKTKRLGKTQWCLNERCLPSIWMEENKIRLFLITKRFNEPCKHFTSLWSLCGFLGTSNDFWFWKVEVLEFWTICIIIVVLWLQSCNLDA